MENCELVIGRDVKMHFVQQCRARGIGADDGGCLVCTQKRGNFVINDFH